MRKFESIDRLHSDLPEGEFKEYLMSKFSRIIEEYGLSGISGIFSIIILEKSETEYFTDKLLEFCEELTLDNTKWLHTVWAASDGYSEDIYIPYSDEARTVIFRRCP